MLACEFRPAIDLVDVLEVQVVDQHAHAHAVVRRVERGAEQQFAGGVLVGDVVLHVERFGRGAGERDAHLQGFGAVREDAENPVWSGCAASSGARAVPRAVAVVAGRAWVTGRSNAVAGGRVAQAARVRSARHAAMHCRDCFASAMAWVADLKLGSDTVLVLWFYLIVGGEQFPCTWGAVGCPQGAGFWGFIMGLGVWLVSTRFDLV